MMPKPWLVRCAGVAACLITMHAAQAATPFDTAGPFVQYTITPTTTTLVTQFGSQLVTAGGSSASYSAAIQGLGTVGTAKFGVTASGILGNGVEVGGWAGWNDQITFSSPGAASGSAGVVTMQLAYSWSANVVGTAHGEAYLDINLRPAAGGAGQYANVAETITRGCTFAGQCGTTESFISGSTGVAPTWANGIATFQFNVVFGQAYTIVVGMNAGAFSTAAGSSIVVDAMHSLNWNGVAAVTVAGVAVPYAVSSLSGLNYALPVPELPPLALWLAGIPMLALLRRR